MTNKLPMQSQEITIESDFKLSGTLTLPATSSTKPYPAVLFIPGSGKVDRNVNIPQLQTNIFKLLTEFFSELGFITLRFDKRGCGKSGGNYLEAGLSDFIYDAKCGLKALKAVPEVDPNRVLVLGHSEGAFIAPTLVAACNGLILLCGGARPGRELLPEQPSHLIKEIKHGKGVKARLLKLLQIHRLINWQFNHVVKKSIRTKKSVIKLLGFVPFNAKWLREFHQFNTHEVLKKVAIPTLVVGGGRDIQVNAKEVAIACELIHKARGKVLERMNHLLRDVDSPHHLLSLLKEYRESVTNPLSRELLDTIELWCQQHDFILGDSSG
jgi:pimeloyl-ACP methyl ester carboxylesterase